MQRFWIVLLLAAVVLVGCQPPGGAAVTPTTPPDPIQLVTEAAEQIRSAESFRITVDQAGPDYLINTAYAQVIFRGATAQYVAPGVMQAAVRVLAAGLRVDIDVFSRGADQWYRAIWTGNQWLNQPFSEGFNPETLIAEDTGFQVALNALVELNYVGVETLENGTVAHHISATAEGWQLNALLAGLIQMEGNVFVDVYIETETRYPVRFVITEPESPYIVTPEPGEPVEPVVWTIDITDINAEPQLDDPEGAQS